MSTYQKITIVGNIGRTPELRDDGESAWCRFNVAVNEKYKDEETTTWFTVHTNGRQATLCAEFLDAGSKVLVEGTIQPDRETGSPRIWEYEGQPRTSYEIRASRVVFLSPRGEKAQQDEFPF